jgi:hypothetical protein
VDVDWSRILAVKIDEPYVTALEAMSLAVNTNPACDPEDERNLTINETLELITTAANAVHTESPRTRVWLNFHWREVEWMRDECAAELNDPTIDVVSLDKYGVPFSDIEDDYNWFVGHPDWSKQQLALVPATAYDTAGSLLGDIFRATDAADRLGAYFAYADGMNEQCDMGLGRMGGTGSYDGCRVWVVAGWMSEPEFAQHGGWRGLLKWDDPAEDIRATWAAELSRPRRLAGHTLSEAEISAVLQVLN